MLAAARPIIQKPLGLGAVEWLPESAVGDEVVALLPRGRVLLDAGTEAELVRAFGTGGEFEAKKEERARLLELVERTIAEIEAVRVAVLAGIAERDRKS